MLPAAIAAAAMMMIDRLTVHPPWGILAHETAAHDRGTSFQYRRQNKLSMDGRWGAWRARGSVAPLDNLVHVRSRQDPRRSHLRIQHIET